MGIKKNRMGMVGSMVMAAKIMADTAPDAPSARYSGSFLCLKKVGYTGKNYGGQV